MKLPKFSQTFAETFAENLGNILPPPKAISLPQKKISWEITYTNYALNILIFVKILKLQFLPKFWIL